MEYQIVSSGHKIGHSVPSVDAQIAEEIEWIEKGVKRFREAHLKANDKALKGRGGGLAEQEIGSSLTTLLLRAMIPAIEELQREALEDIHNKKRKAVWWVPILCLEADKWAIITLRSVLTGLSAEVADARPATPLALQIGRHAQFQREVDLWKKAEAERKKELGEDYVDLYKLMLARVKKVTAKSARKWMQLAEDCDRINWSKETCLCVGMLLLEVLVKKSGGWFEMVLIGSGAGATRQTERQLKLSPMAVRRINKEVRRMGLNKPLLSPMIRPPKPWTYVADKPPVNSCA